MKLGKWALGLCLLGSLFLQSHALAQASPASKGKASVFSFENTRLGGFYQDDKNGPLWLAADMLDGYPAFAQLLQQRDEADGVCRLMQKIEYDQRDIEDLLE